MRTFRNSLFFFLLLFSLFSLCAETITYQSDSSSFVRIQGREKTVLSGNVLIVSESTEIRADEVELYGEDYRFLSCRGDIRVRDEEQGFYLTCKRFFYDREEKRSRAEGSPVMEDQRNEVVVRGGYLEHDEEDDITLVQVGVVIVSIQEGEEMVARAEFARFRREEEVLELSGMPNVFWKGDEYSASRIVIRLDPVEIELEGRVEGRVSTGTQEEQEQNGE